MVDTIWFRIIQQESEDSFSFLRRGESFFFSTVEMEFRIWLLCDCVGFTKINHWLEIQINTKYKCTHTHKNKKKKQKKRSSEYSEYEFFSSRNNAIPAMTSLRLRGEEKPAFIFALINPLRLNWTQNTPAIVCVCQAGCNFYTNHCVHLSEKLASLGTHWY